MATWGERKEVKNIRRYTRVRGWERGLLHPQRPSLITTCPLRLTNEVGHRLGQQRVKGSVSSEPMWLCHLLPRRLRPSTPFLSPTLNLLPLTALATYDNLSLFLATESSSGAFMRAPVGPLPTVPFHNRQHITKFWYDNKNTLPGLFELYREYCAMPAGGGPSEAQFSVMGHLLTPRRMKTSPSHAEDLVIGKTFCTSLRPGESLPQLEVKYRLRQSVPRYWADVGVLDEVTETDEEQVLDMLGDFDIEERSSLSRTSHRV